jgi:hypothetical protein
VHYLTSNKIPSSASEDSVLEDENIERDDDSYEDEDDDDGLFKRSRGIGAGNNTLKVMDSIGCGIYIFFFSYFFFIIILLPLSFLSFFPFVQVKFFRQSWMYRILLLFFILLMGLFFFFFFYFWIKIKKYFFN